VTELAAGLDRPSGVALHGDTCLVAEEGGGRVIRIGAQVDTVIDGLGAPQGIAVRNDTLYIVDAGNKELLACELDGSARQTLATGLPVGAPPGVLPKFLGPIGTLSGPMGPFADVVAAPDGALYLSADAEGSVMCLRPSADL
ncbi:MAG: gluconolaconase, partial [Halioglobus sp.]|nr:gluconolaconase [Halioglobus sp.]